MIRPATESDFPALLTVQQAAFGEYAGLSTVICVIRLLSVSPPTSGKEWEKP